MTHSKLYKSIFLFLLIFQSSGNLKGQEPGILWTRHFGGLDEEGVSSLIETYDSGYMICGFSRSFDQDNENVWMLKTNNNGDSLWSTSYGNQLVPERGISIVRTHDDRFAILAEKGSGTFNRFFPWLIKTDTQGDTIWTKKYTQFGEILVICMQQTTDGGFVILCNDPDNTNDILLIKTDPKGDINWYSYFGHEYEDRGYYVTQTSDNGYVLCGKADITPVAGAGYEIYVVKTDSSGDSLWTKTFNLSNYDIAKYIRETPDSSLVLTGVIGPMDDAGFAAKLNADGELSWIKNMSGGQHQAFECVGITKKNNYLLTGYFYPFNYTSNKYSEIWIVKTDNKGNTLWTKTIGDSSYDFGKVGFQDSDGNYIVASTFSKEPFNRDFHLMKIEGDEIFANFGSGVHSGRLPLTVNFTDSTMGSPVSWEWDFENDGIIDSFEQNPSWTFFNADTYSVKLIVSNEFASDTLLKENYIKAYVDTIPNLFSIKDIPGDQGGWVKVQFAKSAFDTDSLILAKTSSAELYTVEIDDGSGWTAVAATGAYGKSKYSVLVPTTRDSTSESDGLIDFRVIAGMDEGNYVSRTVSGYSVDNLAPSVPENLSAVQGESKSIILNWAASPDEDFQYFNVYRNTEDFFDESLEPISGTTDNSFKDTNIEYGMAYFYALKATDFSGNMSSYSKAASVSVTSINGAENNIPNIYFMKQNYPNPFNPATVISYGLPQAANVKITIYDVAGREIFKLVNEKQNAGKYTAKWDGLDKSGRKAASGLYIYKIEAGHFSKTNKMILIR